MTTIYGYGEDALTFSALKDRLSEVLNALGDATDPGDCLIFFRPSFGRRGGVETAAFGEFDAILVTTTKVYLMESKWDAFRRWDPPSIILLDKPQKLRHRIFSWYLINWSPQYSSNWEAFVSDHNAAFLNHFGKKLPQANKLLAQNLEDVLTRIHRHCGKLQPEDVKDVVLFFYNTRQRSSPPSKAPTDFHIVSLDYSHMIEGHLVVLEK